MFDQIVLRRSSSGQPISKGQLAEALLFYRKVHLIFDISSLLALVSELGPSQLLALLHRSDLSAVYCDEYLGTNTAGVGVAQSHNFVAFSLTGSAQGVRLKSTGERIEYHLRKTGIDGSDAKIFAKRFTDLVPTRRFSGNHFVEDGIVNAAKLDLLDPQYILHAARTVIETIPGGYSPGPDFKFELIQSELGNFVITNVDLERINRSRASCIPIQDPITNAHILTAILEARADLTLAAFYGGDFITSTSTSAIIKLKHASILRRMELNSVERDQFTELVLPDSPSLMEVIDRGERSFDEFLKLLDQSEKFKNWLHKTNPDEQLIRAYHRDVTSEGWIQRLPAKSMRYLLTLGLDSVSTSTGLVAGFVDNFVIEKLLGGWRPNHFVNDRLEPFISGRH